MAAGEALEVHEVADAAGEAAAAAYTQSESQRAVDRAGCEFVFIK